MGYRRDGKRKRVWDKWRQAHRDVLLRAGLPDDVLQDEMSWYYFLEHGFNYTADFSTDQLTPAQAAALHGFLVEQREALQGIYLEGLIRSLEAEFGLPCAQLRSP